MKREYKVIVPYKGRWTSYPPRGRPHYTRDEAIEVMRKLEPCDPYAESPTHRFDLSDVDSRNPEDFA